MSSGVGFARRCRPWLAAAFLAAALGQPLVGAPAAGAATAHVDGISDQNVAYWNGGAWDGGPATRPFAQLLKAAFVGSPAAPLRYARYVVAYDVMCDPQGGAYAGFRAWLRDVEALGLTPVVAFWYGTFHGNACARLPPIPASAAAYNDAAGGVAAFLSAFPDVRIVEAWNEPNDGPGPDVAAATSASFWLAARGDCTAAPCDTVIAGDFTDAPNVASYERRYVAALGGVDPLDWGIHPYDAVNEQQAATLSAFYGGLPDTSTDRVWYTEVAAYYCTPGENALNASTAEGLQQRQAAATHYLVSTLMASPFSPVHVFYYEFMYKDNLAAPCAVRDSALFAPAAGPGSPLFIPRLAARDILPFAHAAASAGAAAPRVSAPPSVDHADPYWQIWQDPWRAASL